MTKIQTTVGHFVAAAGGIASSALFAALTYFGLLAWAIVAGAGIGSPAALPLMLVVALVGAGVSVATVLFPSTLLAHLLVRGLRWPRLAEIPISTTLAIMACAVIGAVVGVLTPLAEHGLRLGIVWALVLLVPLGLYWWCLQATTTLLGLSARVGRFAYARVSERLQASTPVDSGSSP